MIFLKWAAIFLCIALIAAVFGFSGIAAGAVDMAQTLFFIFLAIFVFLLVAGLGVLLVKGNSS